MRGQQRDEERKASVSEKAGYLVFVLLQRISRMWLKALGVFKACVSVCLTAGFMLVIFVRKRETPCLRCYVTLSVIIMSWFRSLCVMELFSGPHQVHGNSSETNSSIFVSNNS